MSIAPKFTNLKPCPVAGCGVHPWLYGAACTLLRAKVAPERVAEILQEESAGCGRYVEEREISEAVEHATLEIAGGVRAGGNGARLPRSRAPLIRSKPKPKWPSFDAHKAYLECLGARYSLTKWNRLSPAGLAELSTEAVLERFYRPGEYYCVGAKKNLFVTIPAKPENFTGAEAYPFVVLNPMKGERGYKKDGSGMSAKCDDNVKERRSITIEFDSTHFDVEHFGVPYFLDVQASLHAHLAELLPLVLLVFSGNESLHGTYATHGLEDERLRRFMAEAVALGADPAMWVKSQFTRMPGGLSYEKARQQIHYFNPEVIYADHNPR